MSKFYSISFAIFLGLTCTGCAPMLQIGGAYFPGWLLSAACGLVAVALSRVLLIAMGLDRALEPRLLTYPALTVFFTLLTYLIFFP